MLKKLILLTTSLAFSMAIAEEKIPGTKVSYSVQKDNISDENTSIIFMDELNDTTSKTYLSLKCAGNVQWVFAIATKHNFLNDDDSIKDADETMNQNYLVTYRIGDRQPATVHELASVNFQGSLRRESMLFYDTNANNAIAQGLIDGNRVSIRIQPNSEDALITGKLDYIFSPAGFAKAFKAVNYCK